jgi:hypothetical protein
MLPHAAGNDTKSVDQAYSQKASFLNSSKSHTFFSVPPFLANDTIKN